MFQAVKIFDIPIKLHWSLAIPIAYSLIIGAESFAAMFYAILYLSILGHELAHSLVAKSLGYEIYSIILHAVGGTALINGFNTIKPKDEILTTIAGPLFNIVIAAISFILMMFLPEVLSMVCAINLFIGVFSLLPIFPRDGGRILRGSLALVYDYKKSTNISLIISALLNSVILFAGLWYFKPIPILLSLYIFLNIYAEKKALEGRT